MKKILIVGASGAGKTHFAGQLLGRLKRNREGALRLVPGGAKNLILVEEVLECLEEGRSAGHTSAATWDGVELELETQSGVRVALEWPEYAGERVDGILRERGISPLWRQTIVEADAWLVFLRPSLLNLYEDPISRPGKLTTKTNAEPLLPAEAGRWDDQARLIEVLQILKFSRSVGVSTNSTPRMIVLLSCWDELDGNLSPEDHLATRLPMVMSYLKTNWTPDRLSIWGLSSLGKHLDVKVGDDDFAVRGPQVFGYVVPPGTTIKELDLTLPILWLINE